MMMMLLMIKRESVDDDIADREVKVMKMLLLIERSRCWRCFCWSKSQSVEDVADRKVKNAEYVVADRTIKVLNMLLIERSKYWRCCCWSKSQSAEDVADRKVKNAEDVVADRKVQVLKMSLLIERSKCWRCCGSKTEDVADDEDWRLKMKTTWCWKYSNDL